jgi:hypothetical protein
MLIVESQPNALVCVTVTVPEGKSPQLMLTLSEVEGPLILPPITVQLYVSPGMFGTEYVPEVNLQIGLGPLITGTGFAVNVMVRLTVESQPNELICVTVIVPIGDEPHDTVTALEVEEPVMLPPVTLHAYVLPPAADTEYDAADN